MIKGLQELWAGIALKRSGPFSAGPHYCGNRSAFSAVTPACQIVKNNQLRESWLLPILSLAWAMCSHASRCGRDRARASSRSWRCFFSFSFRPSPRLPPSIISFTATRTNPATSAPLRCFPTVKLAWPRWRSASHVQFSLSARSTRPQCRLSSQSNIGCCPSAHRLPSSHNPSRPVPL